MWLEWSSTTTGSSDCPWSAANVKCELGSAFPSSEKCSLLLFVGLRCSQSDWSTLYQTVGLSTGVSFCSSLTDATTAPIMLANTSCGLMVSYTDERRRDFAVVILLSTVCPVVRGIDIPISGSPTHRRQGATPHLPSTAWMGSK